MISLLVNHTLYILSTAAGVPNDGPPALVISLRDMRRVCACRGCSADAGQPKAAAPKSGSWLRSGSSGSFLGSKLRGMLTSLSSNSLNRKACNALP